MRLPAGYADSVDFPFFFKPAFRRRFPLSFAMQAIKPPKPRRLEHYKGKEKKRRRRRQRLGESQPECKAEKKGKLEKKKMGENCAVHAEFAENDDKGAIWSPLPRSCCLLPRLPVRQPFVKKPKLHTARALARRPQLSNHAPPG